MFTLWGNEFSWRELILIGKAVNEMHGKFEGPDGSAGQAVQATFAVVMLQIVMLDMVFALDSILTAVGMTEHISIMVIAILVATAVMVFLRYRKLSAEPVRLHETLRGPGT